MEINLVYKDIRYPFIFSFIDDYLPSTSYIAISGVAVNNYHVYSSADGWNPTPSASNLGLIGFDYSDIDNFEYGDTFEIVTSAGTLTAVDYIPIPPPAPYLNWGPSQSIIYIYIPNNNIFDPFIYTGVYQNSIQFYGFDIVYRILVNNLTNIEYIDNLSAYPSLSAVEIKQQTSNVLKELNLGNMSSLRRVSLAGTQGLSAINLTNSFNYINFLSSGDSIFDSSTVDDILINLNNNSVSNGTVSIANSNSPRTNASDAAVTGLLARGWTVTVNPPI